MQDTKTKTEFTGASGNRLLADVHEPRGEAHGNPVLLLHGGGQTRHAWGGAARRVGAILRRERRAHRPGRV